MWTFEVFSFRKVTLRPLQQHVEVGGIAVVVDLGVVNSQPIY
jgi:hypothetical protein